MMPWSVRLPLTLVSAALLMGVPSAGADPVGGTSTGPAEPPPTFFRDLVAGLSAAHFHRNTSEKRWQAGSICTTGDEKTACQVLRRAWVTSIVADDKRNGRSVVQELWLFDFGTSADARKAVQSFSREFDYGPFAKHPYTPFLHGRYALVVEGRFRWHTDGKRLGAYVAKTLERLRKRDNQAQ